MANRTDGDIALTALAVEAERRRKERGLLRYNYGDLVADTTPEERQEIIARYRKRCRRRDSGSGERFVETNDKEDLRSIRQKRGIPEEKPCYHPPKKRFEEIAGKK